MKCCTPSVRAFDGKIQKDTPASKNARFNSFFTFSVFISITDAHIVNIEKTYRAR